MIGRRLILIVALAAMLSAVFVLAGCGGIKVYLNKGAYQPQFTEDLSAYSGRRVNLLPVSNLANDTRRYYYYGYIYRTWYMTPTLLRVFFGSAFEKALKQLGMEVVRGDEPNKTAPSVLFTMKSINDRTFDFEVKVAADKHAILTKRYVVIEPEFSKQQSENESWCQQRAYRMINKLLQKVLTDDQFKAAFFKAVDMIAHGRAAAPPAKKGPRHRYQRRGVVSVRATKMVKDYRTNEVAADRAYGYRMVVVHGRVSDIGKAFGSGSIFIVLAGRGRWGVLCYFSPKYAPEVAKLRRGAWVSVMGRCLGRDRGRLIRLVDSKPVMIR